VTVNAADLLVGATPIVASPISDDDKEKGVIESAYDPLSAPISHLRWPYVARYMRRFSHNDCADPLFFARSVRRSAQSSLCARVVPRRRQRLS